MFSPISVWEYHGGEGRIQRALSAAVVLGLYSGFMLAVAIAMVLGTGAEDCSLPLGSNNRSVLNNSYTDISRWKKTRLSRD